MRVGAVTFSVTRPWPRRRTGRSLSASPYRRRGAAKAWGAGLAPVAVVAVAEVHVSGQRVTVRVDTGSRERDGDARFNEEPGAGRRIDGRRRTVRQRLRRDPDEEDVGVRRAVVEPGGDERARSWPRSATRARASPAPRAAFAALPERPRSAERLKGRKVAPPSVDRSAKMSDASGPCRPPRRPSRRRPVRRRPTGTTTVRCSRRRPSAAENVTPVGRADDDDVPVVGRSESMNRSRRRRERASSGDREVGSRRRDRRGSVRRRGSRTSGRRGRWRGGSPRRGPPEYVYCCV